MRIGVRLILLALKDLNDRETIQLENLRHNENDIPSARSFLRTRMDFYFLSSQLSNTK